MDGVQWYRNNEAIPGATSETYRLTMDDMMAGATISVEVNMSLGDEWTGSFTAKYSIADNNDAWSYDTESKTLTIKSD